MNGEEFAYPDGIQLSGNIFSWIPDYEQAGVYEGMVFKVTDISTFPYLSDADTVTITVYNTNRAPVLTEIEDDLQFVEGSELKTYEFGKFVHPVNMPNLLKSIDFLLHFAKDNPLRDFSNIVCEALYSGVPVLTDNTMDLGEYTKYVELESRDQIVDLTIDDVEMAQAQINDIISAWKGPFRYTNKLKYNFNQYMDANLEVYSGI